MLKKIAGKMEGYFKGSYFLFSGPAVILYTLFFILPAVRGLLYAFTNWDGISPDYNIVWFENFTRIFSIDQFKIGITNTFIYCIVNILVSNSIALVLATLIHASGKFKNFFKTTVFFPVVLSAVVVAYVWSIMYSYDTGAINSFLRLIGLDFLCQEWLGDPNIAIFAVAATMVWGSLGLYTIIYSTGIENIPTDLYEAADIDGASSIQRFLHITYPMVSPVLTTCVVLSTVNGLKVFNEPFLMTKGGPFYRTESISTLIYTNAFSSSEIGLACAYSIVLLVIISVISIIQTNVLRRREVNL